MLVFHVSDTHVHVVVLVDRARAGRLAQALGLALASLFGAPLPPAGITTIEDGGHLRSTFAYVLCNDERHGVVPDPWRENSNLPDLLGARLTAFSTVAATKSVLPRISGDYLRELAGWSGLPKSTAATTLDLDQAHPQLADATAAIVAHANLSSKHPDLVVARGAAVHVATSFGLSTIALAEILDLTPSTVRRLRHSNPPARTIRTLETQLRMRTLLPLPVETAFGEEAPRPAWPTGPKGRQTS
ncbi:hypothetical protein LBMAG42_35120 [Deltaproteobacteria bacterium]|nr:hypothetical protein LBMAG42_35120 [Deltaproteobacteria bacterium]